MHDCLCWWILTRSPSIWDTRVTAKCEQGMKSWSAGPASWCSVCFCVSNSLAQCSTHPLSCAEADTRGETARRRCEILSSSFWLCSVSLRLSILLWFLNMLCWVWRHGWRQGVKLLWRLNEATPIFISQSRRVGGKLSSSLLVPIAHPL